MNKNVIVIFTFAILIFGVGYYFLSKPSSKQQKEDALNSEKNRLMKDLNFRAEAKIKHDWMISIKQMSKKRKEFERYTGDGDEIPFERFFPFYAEYWAKKNLGI